MTEQGTEGETWDSRYIDGEYRVFPEGFPHHCVFHIIFHGIRAVGGEPEQARRKRIVDSVINDHNAASTNAVRGEPWHCEACQQPAQVARNPDNKWSVIHRADYMGWNVVVHDGLNIGPFEKDKAEALVRDHNAVLDAQVARAEAVETYAKGYGSWCDDPHPDVHPVGIWRQHADGSIEEAGPATIAGFERRAIEAETALGVVIGQRDAAVMALKSQCPHHQTASSSKQDERGQSHHYVIENGGYKHWLPCILTPESNAALSNLTTTQPGESAS